MRATGPGQSARLLLDVVELLESERIGYAVIGAVAAAVHGVVRASLDADALVSVTIQQLIAFQEKLRGLGLQSELRRGDLDDPIPALLVVQDGFGNQVDLLAGVRGMEPAAYARCIEVAFENESLRIVGREDFIAMKAFAGGPQDLADAKHAILVNKAHLDLQLLRRLAGTFGKDALAACERLLVECQAEP
ncbi:MAG TPA: hypothetical protein VJS42_19845 [Steroidobacteraceae bacterium]|nr:hypothetical protein [Steroidobacteraceae bacterium]